MNSYSIVTLCCWYCSFLVLSVSLLFYPVFFFYYYQDYSSAPLFMYSSVCIIFGVIGPRIVHLWFVFLSSVELRISISFVALLSFSFLSCCVSALTRFVTSSYHDFIPLPFLNDLFRICFPFFSIPKCLSQGSLFFC